MKVQLARTGRTVSLTRPQKMFAQDRTTIETGFAGDGEIRIHIFLICDFSFSISNPRLIALSYRVE